MSKQLCRFPKINSKTPPRTCRFPREQKKGDKKIAGSENASWENVIKSTGKY
jgi:hypothetical protein